MHKTMIGLLVFSLLALPLFGGVLMKSTGASEPAPNTIATTSIQAQNVTDGSKICDYGAVSDLGVCKRVDGKLVWVAFPQNPGLQTSKISAIQHITASSQAASQVSNQSAGTPNVGAAENPNWLTTILVFLAIVVVVVLLTSPWWFNLFFRPHDVRIVGEVGPLGVDVKWGKMSKASASFEKIPPEYVKPYKASPAGWVSPTQTHGYQMGWKSALIVVGICALLVLFACMLLGIGISFPTAPIH